MVYTAFPVTVDGFSLDTVAWNISAKTRSLAGVRSADLPVPGVDGEIASLNDDLEPTLFSLSMWVLGTDSAGLIPAGSAMAQCRENIDMLGFVFRKRHALLDVRETVGGTVRQFYGKVIDSIVPEVRAGGVARFAVNIKNPDGKWQDVSTSDWSQASAASGTAYEVTTLRGSSEHITDSIITVTGPATNPTVTDFGSGAYVRLNAALPSGQVWRINNETWATRYGAGLTASSADTAGTDAQATTVYGSGYTQFLRLVPTLISSERRVQLTLSGTGFTSATALGVRARRKYGQ